MSHPNFQSRKKQLEKLIEQKSKQLKKAPKGYLSISPINNQHQYYHVITGEAEARSYLSKIRDIKLIRQLAQKSYDAKVLKAAEQELKAWTMLAKYFPNMTVEEIYDTLSPVRKELVTPIRMTDDEFQKQWEAVTYDPGYFKPDSPVYMTDRGERVRSKSEQLIANLLNRLGIPYRYEYPITVMVDGKPRIWRPDFLILDVKNRKEIYLEHFGRLSDADYAKNAFSKMKVYEENDIYEGQNMIYSFETNEVPLDLQLVERKILRAMDR